METVILVQKALGLRIKLKATHEVFLFYINTLPKISTETTGSASLQLLCAAL